jgi:hypothetical protein
MRLEFYFFHLESMYHIKFEKMLNIVYLLFIKFLLEGLSNIKGNLNLLSSSLTIKFTTF